MPESGWKCEAVQVFGTAPCRVSAFVRCATKDRVQHRTRRWSAGLATLWSGALKGVNPYLSVAIRDGHAGQPSKSASLPRWPAKSKRPMETPCVVAAPPNSAWLMRAFRSRHRRPGPRASRATALLRSPPVSNRRRAALGVCYRNSRLPDSRPWERFWGGQKPPCGLTECFNCGIVE